MSNIVDHPYRYTGLTPADDWVPRTEMDFVFDRIIPTLQRIENHLDGVDSFEKAIPVLEALIRDFRQAKANGSQLTP